MKTAVFFFRIWWSRSPSISIVPGVNPHAMVFAPVAFEVGADSSAQSQQITQGFIYAWKWFILSSNTGSESIYQSNTNI